MTQPEPKSYRHYAQVQQLLQAAGYSTEVADALMAFDLNNFHYVRRVMKGDLPLKLIEEVGAGLDLTLFHSLSAILRIQHGFGRAAPQEVTVGLLAEEMNLDPSRASRIAADLVERGYVARAVSQEDGRRSVLTTTEAASTLMASFMQAKWRRTMQLFSTWPQEDILSFSRLFANYCEGMRDIYPGVPHPPAADDGKTAD